MVKLSNQKLILRKTPIAQMRILTQLCREKSTQRKLAQKLRMDKGSLSKRMDALAGKGLIKHDSWKIDSRNKSKVWKITTSGITELLLSSDVENFWKIAFQVFDPNNKNYPKSINFEKLLEKYESKVLEISKDYMLPHGFVTILDQFKQVSLRNFHVFSGSMFPVLQIIGCDHSLYFTEIENKIKIMYPQLHKQMKGEDLSIYADWYKPIHKGKELEKTIQELVVYHLVNKIDKSNEIKYQLTQEGLLLLTFHLFKNLDPFYKYGMNSLRLEHGLNEEKLTKNEKILKAHFSLLIKYNSKLLPGIFYYRDRLEINEYYLFHIIILPFFEIYPEFFKTSDFTRYNILVSLQKQLEENTKNKFDKYEKHAKLVLINLIKTRKSSYSFVSQLSEKFFKKIQQEWEKREIRYQKEWEKDINKRLKSKRESERWMGMRMKEEGRHKSKFSEHEILYEILHAAEWIIAFESKNYSRKEKNYIKNLLPDKKDQEVIKSAFNPLLVQMLRMEEISYDIERGYRGGKTSSNDYDYSKIIENKITFDFYLLYRILEPNKWEKNFHKNEGIKKWHNAKVKKLYQVGKEFFAPVPSL